MSKNNKNGLIIYTQNSTYFVNDEENSIRKGRLGDQTFRFVDYIPFKIGMPAIFHLDDGKTLKTSAIVSISETYVEPSL